MSAERSFYVSPCDAGGYTGGMSLLWIIVVIVVVAILIGVLR